MFFQYKPSKNPRWLPGTDDRQEVAWYSQLDKEHIMFTKDELHKVNVPTELTRGDWNIKDGYKKFRYRTFDAEQSRVRNLLLTTVKYESEHPDFSKPTVLTHSGFFRDIIMKDAEPYDLIYYQGQLIASSRDRRLGQSQLFGYIGIRFEDLLTAAPGTPHKDITTVDNYKHFKTMTVGSIGAVKYQVLTEIDSTISDQLIPEYYTEIKVTVVKKFSWRKAKIAPNRRLLSMVLRAKPYFAKQLLKWILQCHHGYSTHVLLGLRDGGFNVGVARLMDVEQDLLPFLYNECPREAMIYRQSSTFVTQFVNKLLETIKSSDDPHNVWRLQVSPTYTLTKLEGDEAEAVYNQVLIPEFLTWREEHKNTLSSCEWIVHNDTTSDVSDLTDQMTDLKV